jgi:hypothetical protein
VIGAVARIAVAALASAPVPAAAGAGAGAAPVALTAVPARVMLAGSKRMDVRVTNSGTKRVVVDARRAGFALDLRGRPRIARNGGTRSAVPWLTLRPRHFALAPHTSVQLVVASKLPRRVEPGDHDALVLLSTRPLRNARLAVRLRMGVIVVVRAPGRVVRRLELRGLRVARRGKRRALVLVVANRGNVTESLERARVVVSRARTGRHLATLLARSRDLRPRTAGILEFPLRRRPRGWITVRAVIPAAAGRSVLRRTYRIRL